MRYFLTLEVDGKSLESTLNRKSSGNVLFVLCDVTKEEDINVRLRIFHRFKFNDKYFIKYYQKWKEKSNAFVN